LTVGRGVGLRKIGHDASIEALVDFLALVVSPYPRRPLAAPWPAYPARVVPWGRADREPSPHSCPHGLQSICIGYLRQVGHGNRHRYLVWFSSSDSQGLSTISGFRHSGVMSQVAPDIALAASVIAQFFLVILVG